jgi:hypothetical protein
VRGGWIRPDVIGSSAKTYRAWKILNHHGVRTRVVAGSPRVRARTLALVVPDGYVATALACLEGARLPARQVFREAQDGVPGFPHDAG